MLGKVYKLEIEASRGLYKDLGETEIDEEAFVRLHQRVEGSQDKEEEEEDIDESEVEDGEDDDDNEECIWRAESKKLHLGFWWSRSIADDTIVIELPCICLVCVFNKSNRYGKQGIVS